MGSGKFERKKIKLQNWLFHSKIFVCSFNFQNINYACLACFILLQHDLIHFVFAFILADSNVCSSVVFIMKSDFFLCIFALLNASLTKKKNSLHDTE